MAVKTPGPTVDKEYLGSWFSVELDNGIKGAFTEAAGMAIEINVVEVNNSVADTTTRKRPGVTKYNDITLKRTLSADKAFWSWAKSIRDGKADFRTNGAIVLYDISAKEIGRWTFTNAWPSKWSASDLDVGTEDVMVEEVTITTEYLKREK